MTPYESVCMLYRSNPDADFARDMEAYTAWGGTVICTPEVIIIGRPVVKDWPSERLSDLRQVAAQNEADCWFILLLAGSLKAAVKHLPYPLPWFGFCQRGGPPRFIEAEKVLAKLR